MEIYSIRLAQPLFTCSRLGSVRQREATDGQKTRTWPAQYQPADNFRGHFEFGLKYERLSCEFFSRLFHRIEPEDVAAWVRNEPTGRYARRAAFFYAWFTGRQLAAPDAPPNVGYVDAIDAGEYLAFARETVHYIAPPAEMVAGMLDALRRFEARTRGTNPVGRAAAVSFTFIYLHPLADGNGRIHRFLVHHLLAADKAVPANLIASVSATIAGSAKGRADYDLALEAFSRAFMRLYADAYRFGQKRLYPDGVETNFEFLQTEDAQYAWRYMDLTG